MSAVFTFSEGKLPLLISIPHDGRELAAGLEARMTTAARALPDTDWHVRQLYAALNHHGANVIAANLSRYVVDLNRAATDTALYEGQVSTGLIPSKTFAGDDIYLPGQSVSPAEREQRVALYWTPYHDKIATTLETLKRRFGYALLWDAHSIASKVPALFPGVLPDLNIGTFDGNACNQTLADAVVEQAKASPYAVVINERFRGGYITRHYGKPSQHVHALQLELSQRNYMDEKNIRYDAGRAANLAATIAKMLAEFVNAAHRLYAGSADPA